jgi:hypothetical protein
VNRTLRRGALECSNLPNANRSPLLTSENPEPDQEQETEYHQDQAEIRQYGEFACGIELFISLSNFGTPPEVGDSLVFWRTIVYLADHDERKHVGKDGERSTEQSDHDNTERY